MRCLLFIFLFNRIGHLFICYLSENLVTFSSLKENFEFKPALLCIKIDLV